MMSVTVIDVIDLFQDQSYTFTTALPGRCKPTLGFIPARGELVFTGGSDAGGAPHDDVWRVPVGVGDARCGRRFNSGAAPMERRTFGHLTLLSAGFDGATGIGTHSPA